MKKDCYFFVDYSGGKDEWHTDILCVECRTTKMPDVGWFYAGSKYGYGPFEYKCCICKDLIYSFEDDKNKEDEIQGLYRQKDRATNSSQES